MACYAEDFPSTAGLEFALDPLDNFEDFCADLDSQETTPRLTIGSHNTNADFNPPTSSDPATHDDILQPAAAAPRKKKQRSLVNAQNAQRRFRERQKACT